MPGDPLVIRVMRQFKNEVRAREAQTSQEMARRWLQIEDALGDEIDRLAEDFDRRRARGETITQGALFRLQRYQALLQQTQLETARYQQYAQGIVAREQGVLGQWGVRHAAIAIQVQHPSLQVFFDVLPGEAIETLIGFASGGSPLDALLQAIYPQAADGMTRALLEGVGLGLNPRQIARNMRNGLGIGLDQALVISRDQALRAYRATSDEQYRYSGVVESKRRLVTRDDRTCPACLMADGEVLALDEAMYDHTQGRCTAVPTVMGLPAVQWQLGPDWFLTQDTETQRRILGPGRYDAWRAGQFDLDQIVTRRDDPTWGRSLHPAPLHQLVGETPPAARG